MSDSHIDRYDEAWAVRGTVMDAIMASETSLSRVLARFSDFEAEHDLMLVDGALRYSRSAQDGDPLLRLERPLPALSCGQAISGFPYAVTDIGGLIAALAKGCDNVVEFGSGYGRRLFETWLRGGPRDARYVGIEPAASGRALAERLARLEPSMAMTTLAGDHTGFDLSGLGGQRTLFLTCFTMMFVPALSAEFFQRVAALPGEVVCLFIEPVGFQIAANDPCSPRQREAAMAKHLNLDFFATFNQAVKRGLFEPMFVGTNLFGLQTDPMSQASIIVAAKN